MGVANRLEGSVDCILDVTDCFNEVGVVDNCPDNEVGVVDDCPDNKEGGVDECPDNEMGVVSEMGVVDCLGNGIGLGTSRSHTSWPLSEN